MSREGNALRPPRSLHRILVVIVTRIGDTLLGTPAIRALAETYPEASITVMAHPKRVALLEHLPFIHRLESITKRQTMLRGRGAFLRPRRPYDAAIVFGHDNALLRYALRVSDIVVGQTSAELAEPSGTNPRLLWVDGPTPQEHAIEAGLRLAHALGATPTGKQLSCAVVPAEAANARHLLEEAATHAAMDLPRSSRLVGLQLKSFPTKAYRDWPMSSFAALLQRLFDADPHTGVVVLGDTASAEPGKELMRLFPGRICSLAGRMNLRQMVGVMSLLQLYIGVDTGPTHIAGALGLPMVALYHCRHRGTRLAPLDHTALSVIEHPATDADCGRHSAMADISVDVVWNAVRLRLQLNETHA